MSCKELVEFVTDYLEGALSAAERKRFEQHLRGCDPCVGYIEQMRLTVQTLGKLTEETIPPEAEAKLLEVFRDWKRG